MAPESPRLPPELVIAAKPYDFRFPSERTALLVIDMQRDFLLEGGFGHIQGGSLQAVQASISPTKKLLHTFREAGLPVFHTREGHQPDLSDCPSSKLNRQAAAPGNSQHIKVIGDVGDMGRLLIRGAYGHDLIDELQPWPNEVIIDKPGKGAFWNTSLLNKLKARAITHLIVSGVTTECCFATTIREANDRGLECCGIEDATAGYNNSFKGCSLEMLYWSQGLFGFVASLNSLLDTFAPYVTTSVAGSATTPPQTPPAFDGDLTIAGLQRAYRKGLSLVTVVESIIERIEKYNKIDPAVWIHREPDSSILERARQLQAQWPDPKTRPALFGVPFNVKDSIDVAGIPTTTACPSLAHVPSRSAPVFEAALYQGAIFIGKVNLDQLATGLTGCRSPYGITRSVFNHEYISGGSSSGSCVSVGARLVSFSIATDTAGSGRVPSAFNGVVGYKPTRGLISAQGVTPACLSLDCIAIIAQTVTDARTIWDLTASYDPNDRYSKATSPTMQRHINSIGPQSGTFTFGIPPPSALTILSAPYRHKFNEAVQTLQSLGGQLRPIDWTPFEKAGELLYDGSFVCERLASLPDDWLSSNKANLHPVIESIFSSVDARGTTAVQAYRDLQAKALYTRQAEMVFEYGSLGKKGVDVIVVPTAPTQWTVDEVLASPIKRNSELGIFTHCGNVLDLCAVAVPAGTYPVSELRGIAGEESKSSNLESQSRRSDGKVLPFGITFLGGSNMDAEILGIADRFDHATKHAERL